MIKKGGYDNVCLNVMLSFGSKEIEWVKEDSQRNHVSIETRPMNRCSWDNQGWSREVCKCVSFWESSEPNIGLTAFLALFNLIFCLL